MSQNHLEIKNLSKTYPKAKHAANKNLSYRFEVGQLTALLGHNGAGKTTLLNQVVGLTKADSGDILYQGRSLLAEPDWAREQVTMMPQLHAPLKGVTVRQALVAIGQIRGLSGQRLQQEIEKLLSALDMTDWADVASERLSGGLKRLTSFAMTMINPSKIILLDEPTNDVDPPRRKKLWLYLRNLARQGYIIIVVTHNLMEVDRYADSFCWLERGEIKKSGRVKDLSKTFGRYQVSFSCQLPSLLEDFPYPYQETDDEIKLEIATDDLKTLFAWFSQDEVAAQTSQYRLVSIGLEEDYEG